MHSPSKTVPHPQPGRLVVLVTIAWPPAGSLDSPNFPGLAQPPVSPEQWALPQDMRNGCLYQEPALSLAVRDTQKTAWLPWETPAMLLSGRLGLLAQGLRLGSTAICLQVHAWAGWGARWPCPSSGSQGDTGRLSPPPAPLCP